MRRGNRRFAGLPRHVTGFPRQIGQVHEPRSHLIAPARQAHAVFDHAGDRGAVEGAQSFVFAKFVQPPAVLPDDVVVHLHLFVELHAHLEDLFELLFMRVENFIKIAVADQDDLHREINWLGLERGRPEREKHLHGLNFQFGVVQRALQRPPDTHFRQRVERIHDEKAAVGAQHRARPQVHEIGGPHPARIVAALNRPEEIRVRRRGLEDHRRGVLLVMAEKHIDPVDAERIAFRSGHLREDLAARRSGAGFLLVFPFLERIEIIEDVMPHLLEVFGNVGGRVFFLELLDKAVHQDRGGLLLEVAEFARQFAGKRQRLAIDDGELLPELLVFAFQLLRRDIFEFSFLHQLGDVFDRHHLPVENRENFRQRHRAHLHVSKGKLLPRNAARKIIHQLFFPQRITVDDASLLPLERFAFEHLRDSPAQKVDARLHVFLEAVGLAARQSQQPRAVRVLEIINVTAVGARLASRLQLFDEFLDHAAAARAR